MIGRNYKVGLGKETTRGTAIAPSIWVPKYEVTHDEKREYIVDESSIGIIAEGLSQAVVKEWAEGELSGKMGDKSFGLLLLVALGQVASAAKAGETLVYEHTFSLLNSNTHPALTIEIKNDLEQLAFALGALKSLKLKAEIGKYVEFNAGFESKKGATATSTPAYTAENEFHCKHAVLKLADTLAGLDAASAVDIKSIEISIDKNIESQFYLGSIGPSEIYNKQISVEGSIETVFKDLATFRALFKAGTQKAMRIDLVNSDVTIGTSANPRLKIDMPKVYMSDWSRAGANNEIVKQTIKFKGVYSLSDSKLIEMILTNLQTSY